MSDATMLRGLRLFERCSVDDLSLVGATAEELEVEPNEVVVREGRHDHEFYVILEGMAAVTRDGTELARLGPGQSFGETALLTGQPRNATVQAVTAMRLLVLPEETFHELVQRLPGFSSVMERGAGQQSPATADHS